MKYEYEIKISKRMIPAKTGDKLPKATYIGLRFTSGRSDFSVSMLNVIRSAILQVKSVRIVNEF